MGQTKIFRPTSSRIIAIATWTVLGITAVTALFSGSAAQSWGFLALLGFIGATAWAFFWRPLFEVSDGGLLVVNPFRTTHVPWPAFSGIHVHGTAIITTIEGQKISVYAAPITSKRSGQGVAVDAAVTVEARHNELSRAGYLNLVRLEGAQVTRTTSTVVAVVLGGLAAANIAFWVF